MKEDTIKQELLTRSEKNYNGLIFEIFNLINGENTVKDIICHLTFCLNEIPPIQQVVQFLKLLQMKGLIKFNAKTYNCSRSLIGLTLMTE